jgi:hypothetical protein
MDDCRKELQGLLVEEVGCRVCTVLVSSLTKMLQRLMGASLLVFKNKSDVPGSMSEEEVREVSRKPSTLCMHVKQGLMAEHRHFSSMPSAHIDGTLWLAAP